MGLNAAERYSQFPPSNYRNRAHTLGKKKWKIRASIFTVKKSRFLPLLSKLSKLEMFFKQMWIRNRSLFSPVFHLLCVTIMLCVWGETFWPPPCQKRTKKLLFCDAPSLFSLLHDVCNGFRAKVIIPPFSLFQNMGVGGKTALQLF